MTDRSNKPKYTATALDDLPPVVGYLMDQYFDDAMVQLHDGWRKLEFDEISDDYPECDTYDPWHVVGVIMDEQPQPTRRLTRAVRGGIVLLEDGREHHKLWIIECTSIDTTPSSAVTDFCAERVDELREDCKYTPATRGSR